MEFPQRSELLALSALHNVAQQEDNTTTSQENCTYTAAQQRKMGPTLSTGDGNRDRNGDTKYLLLHTPYLFLSEGVAFQGVGSFGFLIRFIIIIHQP